MGSTTNVLPKENWQKTTVVRRSMDQSHIGQLTKELFCQMSYHHLESTKNNMCPSGLGVHHPIYEMLIEYATNGCPVKTSRNWTKEEIHEAVMRVPHEYVLSEEGIANFSAEAKGKIA